MARTPQVLWPQDPTGHRTMPPGLDHRRGKRATAEDLFATVASRSEAFWTSKPPSPDALPNVNFIEYGICEVDSRPTDTGIHVRKCVCVKRDLTTQQRVLFCKEKSPSLQVNGH